MDEQQIIGDILDKLYGYDSALKEEDSEIIKAKNKEKDEKSKDLKTQINNICKDLENELKTIIGLDVSGMKKIIRFQVLTSIKAEIDNGNNVVDSNGKISTGKVFDIIKQSKSEILDYANNKRESAIENKGNIDVVKPENKDDIKKNISENLSNMGIKLSSGAMSELENAIRRVNEFIRIIKEKVDSGMNEKDAIDWYFDQMSKGEQEEFMLQLELAGKYELANLLNQEKNQENPEKADQTLQNEETQRNFTETEEGKTSPNALVPKQENNDKCYDFNLISNAFSIGCGRNISLQPNKYLNESSKEVCRELERVIDEKSVYYSQQFGEAFNEEPLQYTYERRLTSIPEEQIKGNDDSLDITTYSIYDIKTSNKEDPLRRYLTDSVFFLTHEYMVNQTKKTDIETGSIIKKSMFGNEDISWEEMITYTQSREESGNKSYQFTQIQPETYINPLATSREKKERLTDEFLEDYVEREGEELFIEEGTMRGDDTGIIGDETVLGTITPAPTSTTPPPPPTSIVEEMTVDGSGTTQAEQGESSKKVTLSASTMKALVESQAEARKMLEASEIIHGQTPERPTTGKTETQVAPVADKDEKGDGEPEEH